MARGPMLLQRLSSRERRFVGVLALLLLLGAGVFTYLYLGSKIAEVEETLLEGRESIAEIRLKAREYLDSMRRKSALEGAIKENDPRIQTAIDSVAKKVNVTRLRGADHEETSFDKVLRYEAKTTERAIVFGEGKKKKRDRNSEFVELSQPAEYSFLKFVDLVRFLEQIESPDHLMYVSKLVVTRKYMEPEFVQGKLTIATFIHKPQKDEEDE